MILDLEFKYAAKVRLRRRSGYENEGFLGNASFAIRDVDAGAAPVAMWWTPTDRSDLGGHQVAMRHMEGALWQPVCAREHVSAKFLDGRSVPLAPTDRESSAFGACFRPGRTRTSDDAPASATRDAFVAAVRERPLFQWGGDAALGRVDDAMRVAQVLGDNRAAVEAEVAKALEGLAFVDGTLHERVGMPAVKVGGRSAAPRTAEIDSYRYDGGPHDEYRMDRYDEATAGCADAGRVAALRPEVLLPGALEFDEERHVVRGAVARVVGAMASRTTDRPYGRSVLASYPDDVLFAYVDLRDALAADVGVDGLARLASAYADALRPHGTLSDDARMLRDALDRLERDRASYVDEASLLAGAACA